MVSAADNVTGLTGLTLTTETSKPGTTSFSTPMPPPPVTELGYGWYDVLFFPTETDTLGDLAVHITAPGAVPSDFILQVVPDDFGQAPTGEENAQSVLQSVVLTIDEPSLRIIEAGTNSPIASLTLKQLLTGLLTTSIGDRDGVGTKTITGTIPGVSGVSVEVTRVSSSKLEATVVLPPAL